ncbi:MAG TPA: class D sortase [Vicinamibacterales bacterium]|nr:class D sortase [Vicinamibacterales bacterium]
MSRASADRVMRAAERLLFAIALAALAWFAAGQIHAAREQAALSRELEAARRAAAADASSSPSGSTAATAPALARRAVVGRIEVPRLRLSALAREGVDVRTLRGSVGHVPGTALPGEPGNAAFAAHRDTFFRPLAGIKKDDTVLVTTAEGVHRYRVFATRIVSPDEVSVLRSGQLSQLTLVTCYPFDYVGSAPQRFIVHAELLPPSRAAAAAQ